MGYPAKNLQPTAMAPSAHAMSPFMKCGPTGRFRVFIKSLRLLILLFNNENREIRTHRTAETANYAFALINNSWRMNAAGVNLIRLLQHLSWTVLDAVTTTLALILKEMNLCFRRLHFFQIKGCVPNSFRQCLINLQCFSKNLLALLDFFRFNLLHYRLHFTHLRSELFAFRCRSPQ